MHREDALGKPGDREPPVENFVVITRVHVCFAGVGEFRGNRHGTVAKRSSSNTTANLCGIVRSSGVLIKAVGAICIDKIH